MRKNLIVDHHTIDQEHLKYCDECAAKEIFELEKLKMISVKELEKVKHVSTKYLEYIQNPTAFRYNLPKVVVTDVELNDLQNKLRRLQRKSKRMKELTKNVEMVSQYAYELHDNLHLILGDVSYTIYQNKDNVAAIKSKHQWLKYDNDFISNLNIWNDLFTIHIDKEFATINNFKLSIASDKDHLNMGFGECVLALYCITNKTKLKYYTPMPFGQQSYFIDKDKKRYNLYISDDRNWKIFFNEGIKAFLVCMSEIEMRLKITFRGKIDLKKNLIGGCLYFYPENHKIETNQKNWNNACRYILSNLKMCLIKINEVYLTL
jgi:hypothetical protein